MNEWQPPNSSYAQEKFEELHRKKLEYGYDFNKIIQKKKAFRNPSIYEKLILHCGIDEFGNNSLNYPKVVTTGYFSRYKFPRRALWRPSVRQGVLLWRAGSGAEGGDGQAGEGGRGEEEGGGSQAQGARCGDKQEEQVGSGGESLSLIK